MDSAGARGTTVWQTSRLEHHEAIAPSVGSAHGHRRADARPPLGDQSDLLGRALSAVLRWLECAVHCREKCGESAVAGPCLSWGLP